MGLCNIANFSSIDDLSRIGSPLHHLHPLSKVIVCFVFIIAVMSFSPVEISGLMPFLLYPVATTIAANIPAKKILKMILPALPFILLVAIFNPFIDRRLVISFENLVITRGMLSFLSIVIRSLLTLSAVLLLVATTGIYNIGYALQSLKMPSVFVAQIIFLHRYIFVLAEEAITMKRAALSRSPYGKHPNLTIFGHMLSSLIARSLDKSVKIYSAMLARGFSGKIELQKKILFSPKNIVFLVAWIFFLVVARRWNIPELTGNIILELIK